MPITKLSNYHWLSKCTQWKFSLDFANAQADPSLSLLVAHVEDTFSDISVDYYIYNRLED